MRARAAVAGEAWCDHCGLPVGAGGHRREVAGVARAFCCLGCAVANRLAGRAGAEGTGPSAVWLARIGLGVLLSGVVMSIQAVVYLEPEAAASASYRAFAPWAQLVASVPVMAALGLPLLWSALAMLRAGRVGADLLIGVGLVAGFGASLATTLRGEIAPLYYDTVTSLATLVAAGRWLEASAKERASAGLRTFLSAAERPARRVLPGAAAVEEDVRAADLRVGDLVRVRPGERLPADGVVRAGRALLDEASLTGEPLPRAVAPGDAVRAPATPTDGALDVEVTAVGEGTLLAQVARVLRRARAERAPVERLADRVSAVFVPAILLLAVGVGAWQVAQGREVAAAAMHALAVLVVACPCALGIATPLAVTAALGRLAERGILVRTGAALADLPRVRTVAFDKTGTLTQGAPRVGAVRPVDGVAEDELLRVAASVEHASEHALARGVVRGARERGLALAPCGDSRVAPGRGIEGLVEVGGRRVVVKVGSGAWLGVPTEAAEVAVVVDGRVAGTIALADELRPSARRAVDELRAMGVATRILSGDDPRNVEAVRRALGLPEGAATGGLLPDAKVEAVRALGRESDGAVAFAGDGINDAPALAAADLGIAVGSGTDLARETAAVSLLGDDLARVPALLRAAARTRRAVAWNLVWAFAYNVVAVGWTLTSDVAPVAAALAMVASSVFVVGNSARLRRTLDRDLGP